MDKASDLVSGRGSHRRIRSGQAGLRVQDGPVAGISTEPSPARDLDRRGSLFVLPGMIDCHVHFMAPGPAEREEFITGSSAAAMG